MLYYHIDVIGHFTQKCTFHVAEEVRIKIKLRDQIVFMLELQKKKDY